MTFRPRRPRVLVVAYDFPPHGAIGTMRTLRVVRELCARGWDITVLTGAPETYLPTTPVDPVLLDRVPREVRVVRSKAFRPWNAANQMVRHSRRPAGSTDTPSGSAASSAGSAMHRRGAFKRLAAMHDLVDAALSIPDREAGWLLPAVMMGAFGHSVGGRPDVIYSSAPPWTGHLVAGALKSIFRCSWVADFRDPWARAPWRSDRRQFVMKAAARLERWIIRRAERVVFVTAANCADFERVYGQAGSEKFVAIPNGCDPAEIDSARAAASFRSSSDLHVMLHAGSLYAGRTPVPLLRALARAVSERRVDPSRFRLTFLGVNALNNIDLHAAARDLGLENVVEFLPRVSRAEGLRAMATASSLLLLQPGHGMSIPGKLYEYLAAGRPILAIADQAEISALLHDSGAGLAVGSENESAIVDALIRTVEAGAAAAKPIAREFFDGTIGAGRIADVLASCLDERRTNSEASVHPVSRDAREPVSE